MILPSSLISSISGETLYKINDLLEKGHLKKRAHPNGELFIYNYSDKCQYDDAWTNETLQCRGLIADKDGNIRARPFHKFFNHNPYLPRDTEDNIECLYQKMDGSLGISYFYDGKPYIASRGSFDSEQAIEATNILYDNYSDVIPLLDKRHTLLFEIIYPSNRIVVDYSNTKDIILLATIDIETGQEIDTYDQHFNHPKTHSISDFGSLKDIRSLNVTNEEGFVVKYKSGLREKIKFEEYVRLHKIVTEITPLRIWEYVSGSESFDIDELIGKIPDESYGDIKSQINSLLSSYESMEKEYKSIFEDTIKNLCSPEALRKDIASKFTKHENPSLLFSMLDGRDYKSYIWKTLKPS